MFGQYEEAGKKAEETSANIEKKKELLPALTATVNEADAAEQQAKTALETEQGSFHKIQERVTEAKPYSIHSIADIRYFSPYMRLPPLQNLPRQRKNCKKAKIY